jgi:hypothetical protein
VVSLGCLAPAGDESFIIRSNLATAEGAGCTFTPSLSAASLSRGQVLLDSPIPYLFHPLIESRITAATGKESLRTIFLNGANIELQVGPSETIDAANTVSVDDTIETIRFRSLFSAPLPPNGGLTAADLDLVPLSTLAAIRARIGNTNGLRVHVQVTATATMFGDYYGDQIESSPFQFPVTVCNDCVIANRDPVTGLLPACETFEATPRLGNPCNVFQDGVVDCCAAANGVEQCPAVTVTPET